MSGLLVMRNEVSLWLDPLSPSPAIFSLSLPLQSLQLLSPSEARDELGLPLHNLTFSATVTMETRPRPSSELIESLVEVMQK